ncbi:MAG: FixH family protein [Hyphomicrobiaceae bacterium]
MTSALTGPAPMQPKPEPGTITGRHVLFGLLAFFGVVFAVNGWFLYEALSTHTGVVSNEPYRKGLAYNERIAAEARQSERGWAAALEFSESGSGPITFALTDRSGAGVTGLSVRGRIGRHSTQALDTMLLFQERAPGRYVADIGKLSGGTWTADVEAGELTSTGEAIVWRHRQRIWIKP